MESISLNIEAESSRKTVVSHHKRLTLFMVLFDSMMLACFLLFLKYLRI